MLSWMLFSSAKMKDLILFLFMCGFFSFFAMTYHVKTAIWPNVAAKTSGKHKAFT